MSAKWYPEGYSYPTLPPNFGGSPATSSSGKSSGHRPSLSRSTAPARDGAAGRVGYYDRSIKSTSCHTSVLGHPPLDSTAGRPELVSGLDYFKIGDIVQIRRYHTDKNAYSNWLPGRVVRPIFKTCTIGGDSRNYVVSYTDPYTQEYKEKTFSPWLNEISEIAPERPSSPCSDKPTKASTDTAAVARMNAPVYARIKLSQWTKEGSRENRRVWVPALPLAPPGVHGLHIRVLAGQATHQEFSGVTEILPYSPKTASECRKQGHLVEGDGLKRYV
ncbi:hypothetical protein K443DRAFT_273945 [Laccaria amethystina LaAM-08-1]|uniref:Uncharacterized protein n=1 Tax=Laccaria amethystina LaAM-08-1 TaxID=1095629 RepID=A0A0C9XKJ2_9AGAR|nr:hypothetical protein K443DRAFT_273945 [Laccaria amethystina LaAM-08-1]